MEILDIIDKDDNVIGNAPREEIYKKGLSHRMAYVLVFNEEGKMALQLRSSKMGFCPNHWFIAAGGHVQSGESCFDAALREYQEELGVNTEIEEFSKGFYYNELGPDKMVHIFKTIYNGPFNIDPEEVSDVNFFSIDEIKTMIKNGEKIHPELLFILKKHFF